MQDEADIGKVTAYLTQGSFNFTSNCPNKASKLARRGDIGNDRALPFGYEMPSLFDESLDGSSCSVLYRERHLRSWSLLSLVARPRIVPRRLYEQAAA